SGDFAN
ncbi:alkaline phosphatase family protein, partial [Vibrio parahaemolyticus V-223/04]